MNRPGDPGFVDADQSQSFDVMLASLDHFDGTPLLRAARERLAAALEPRPGMRLLDAGCGTGLDVATMAPLVAPDGIVTGIDLSERMVEIARDRYGRIPGASFRAGDVRRLELPDDTFDAAWSMRTLQYLDDPMDGLRELTRVTRPGGRVLVVEGGFSASALPDSELTRRIFGPRTSMAMHLPLQMHDAGLEVVDVQPAFVFEVGEVDPWLLLHAEEQTGLLVQDGSVSQAEGDAWLRGLKTISRAGRWSAVDCVFVVCGRVPGG